MLHSMPEYVDWFKGAFPAEEDPVTFENMARAIETGSCRGKLRSARRAALEGMTEQVAVLVNCAALDGQIRSQERHKRAFPPALLISEFRVCRLALHDAICLQQRR